MLGRRRMKMKTRTTIVLAVACLALALIVTTIFITLRDKNQRDACGMNQRMIAAAIESTAMARRWVEGDMPDATQFNECIRGGKTPICPSGGQYVIPRLPELPYCTVHGKLVKDWPK
jgi:hypothetical protein